MEETRKELEQKASKLLDEISSKEEIKEQLKQAMIDLLIFGKAEFVYKEEEKTQ